MRPCSRRSLTRSPAYRLLMAFILAAGPLAAEDSALPRYDLDLRLDVEARSLSGRAVVTLPASMIDDGRARFDIAGNGVLLEIDRVATTTGAVLEPSRPDDDGIVEIPIDERSDPVILSIDFHRPVDGLGPVR